MFEMNFEVQTAGGFQPDDSFFLGKECDTMAKKAAAANQVMIRPPKMKTFRVKLVGKTPLIISKFSNKAEQQIKEKQEQKAKGAKAARDPESEFREACYVMPGQKAGTKKCKYAIPDRMIKRASVEACRFIDGMAMTFCRGAFHIMAEAGGMLELKYKSMAMRTDHVRLKNGALDLRYRPEFTKWHTVVEIYYNAEAISPEQIINLLATAGVSCGLGELRPNSKEGGGGSNGLFEVKTAA